MSRGRPIKDLTGRVFSRLTAVELAAPIRGRNRRWITWLCRCSCGGTVVARANNLVAGTAQSCGCLRRDRQPLVATFGPGSSQVDEHW